jgi:hypothetical protein
LKKRNAGKIAKDLTVTIPPRAHTRIQRLVIVLLGLLVSLAFRFWGHNEAYESNHFVEQKRKMMTKTTPTSTSNKTTKVKTPREGGFCAFLV